MTVPVLDALERAWRRTDALFGLLRGAWGERPIPLRHPFVFYLGHLPAFAWNQVGRGVFGRGARHAHFDELFERGIDPADETAAQESRIDDWPAIEEITTYRDDVREALRELARELAGGPHQGVGVPDGGALVEGQRILHLVLEHELMHHETLLYALYLLPTEHKHLPEHAVAPTLSAGRAPELELRRIPAGTATLGARFEEIEFGWDNEFPLRSVEVAELDLSRWPVSIGEFRAFVEADGYANADLWEPGDHAWVERSGLRHPLHWSRASHDGGTDWSLRTMFGTQALDDVGGWPVVVSHAEAAAYARWRGMRLPTEAELHRAAYGTPEGTERSLPWGEAEPTAEHGNFDLHRFDPVPIGSHPGGRSAFGVDELIGNGWEWTSTRFVAHEGFEPWMHTYPGYSSDFFDEDHCVLFGASWVTDRRFLRRSFRNWFQRRYPYAFTTFRMAR